MLTVEAKKEIENAQSASILKEKFPSYLHLAQIMNERTQEERETFGKVNLNERFKGKGNQFLSEEKIDQLIDIYVGELKMPSELIVKTVERSRDRFLRELSKFEAFFE